MELVMDKYASNVSIRSYQLSFLLNYRTNNLPNLNLGFFGSMANSSCIDPNFYFGLGIFNMVYKLQTVKDQQRQMGKLCEIEYNFKCRSCNCYDELRLRNS